MIELSNIIQLSNCWSFHRFTKANYYELNELKLGLYNLNGPEKWPMEQECRLQMVQ